MLQRSFALLLFPLAASAAEFPVVGGWGFDWLAPKSAKCRRIEAADAARFRKCEFLSPGGAFGLTLPYHRCTAPGRSEHLVYATRAQCTEALETMRANAP